MKEFQKDELISFIMLTYKNFDGIYDTLDSLFIQDYPFIELIISDDGSPNADQFLPEIKEYIEEHKRENVQNVMILTSEKNEGTVRNANKAYKAANGAYIKDLGGDDTLRDSHTLTRYKEFLDASGCLICFSKLQGITIEGDKKDRLASCEDDYALLSSYTPLQLRDRLFRRNCLPAPGRFLKKELFEKYGYLKEDTRLIEDYPYWLYLCSRGVKMAFLDERLVNYRLSGVSSAGRYSRMFMDDLLVIYDKYIFPYDKRFGILQPFYNFLKRAGLHAYIALADWEGYSMADKVKAMLKYGVFFAYIKIGNAVNG